jgi:hypothetical protein
LPKRFRDLFIGPVRMLIPQRSLFQSAHRPDKPERDLRSSLERHFAKSFDLLGMKAAFDEHTGTLLALAFRREIDLVFEASLRRRPTSDGPEWKQSFQRQFRSQVQLGNEE